MSKLFSRVIQVEIGDDTESITVPTTFKIGISIIKMIDANSSEGNVTIYNLADNTKNQIRNRGERIKVFAGYADGDNVALIHDSEILRTQQDDDGEDRKTIVYLGGRLFSTTNATFSKSYNSSITVRQIVQDALPSFNLTFSQDILNLIPENERLPSFSFNGKTTELLDSLLQPLNIQWFEQNSQIFLSKQGTSVTSDENDIYVLNSNTGLIKTSVQTDQGVNAVCMLNPRLLPGTIVKIESDVVQYSYTRTYYVQKQSKNTEGYYKIIQTTFNGDNWDGQFQATLQCVPYNQNQTTDNTAVS